MISTELDTVDHVGGVVGVVHRVDSSQNPFWTYLDSLGSQESRRAIRSRLNRVARLVDPDADGESFPWHLLRYQHTNRIRALLADSGMSPSSRNMHLSALRRVLKEAWRLQLIEGEDYQRAADLADVKGSRVPPGQHIPADAVAAALWACEQDEGPAGARDEAMIALLYGTGARRHELVSLDVSSYLRGRAIRILGKGDVEREVSIPPDVIPLLEAWLAVRGTDAGPLFVRVFNGRRGKHPKVKTTDGRMKRLSGHAVSLLLDKRFTAAGVIRPRPHDFRRTYVGELLDAGVDLATAQALVGHASPATTARYDRRGERARADAASRLSLPKAAPLRKRKSA